MLINSGSGYSNSSWNNGIFLDQRRYRAHGWRGDLETSICVSREFSIAFRMLGTITNYSR
jgi:hypothetical protein